MGGSPPFCHSLFGQHTDLRFELLDAACQLVDQLSFRIGQISVFQIITHVSAGARYASGNADHGAIIGYRANHYRPGADLGVVSDSDVAENLGARSDHHIVAYGGMPLSALLAGSTQRHALVHDDVIADFGGFSDHHSHSVVDKTAPANMRSGMDFDASGGADKLRQNAGRQRKTSPMQLVSQPVQQDGMEARITKENLDGAFRGGIATEDGIDLFPEGSEHGQLSLIIALAGRMQNSVSAKVA